MCVPLDVELVRAECAGSRVTTLVVLKCAYRHQVSVVGK
jgi:hypothetical protein